MLKQFTNDTFPINIAIAVDSDLSNVTKHFTDNDTNKIIIDKWGSSMDALHYYNIINSKGISTSLLVFRETPKVSTIAHGVSHSVDFIFKHISEKNPCAESKAYLTEWIFKCFMKCFKITIE